MQSNSAAPLVYKMYQNFNIHEVDVQRNVSGSSSARGKIKELIITNY
jgi:hypothetical protein